MDRLFAVTVMQRAGICPDKFSSLVSREEYLYFQWRKRVCEAHWTGDWKAIEKLLECKEAQDRTCNEILQKQYYMMMCGIIQDKLYQNRIAGAELVKEALELTAGNMTQGQMRNAYFSMQEIQLILLWLRFCEEKEFVCECIGKLLKYVETHFDDRQEQCKLYPVLVMQIFPYLYSMSEYEECGYLTKKAIKMIRETGQGECATFLLADYLKTSGRLGKTERGDLCEKQLEVYRELERKNGFDLLDRDTRLLSSDVRQEVFLIQELISDNRKKSKISQEQLAETVECVSRTLSRIETGKNVPHRKQYQVLAEELGLPEDFYFSEIETEHFDTLETVWEIALNIVNRNWKEVEKCKKHLEGGLDMSITSNKQYYKELEHILAEVNGETDVKYSFEHIIELLKFSIDTIPEEEDVTLWNSKFWQRSFSKTEISLLIYLSDVLAARGKSEQAVYVLERLLVRALQERGESGVSLYDSTACI